MNEAILYKETQRFRQWWIWLLLLGVNALSVFSLIQQVILHKTVGQNPMSDEGVIFTAIAVFLISTSLFFLRLDTTITADKINVRFFPFVKKEFFWSEIEEVEVRQYRPVLEYGGWGIRGFGANRALNVSGNMGLQLVLKNGKKLLIGTQNAEELKSVIQRLKR